MKRIFFYLATLMLAAVGCRAQQPTTTWQVNLTWTAPAACTATAPCTYAVSRTVPVNGVCPATTGTNYALVGTSSSQATIYSDTSVASGTSYCYIAQTVQGGATSAPSNTATVAVPVNPSAPGTPAATAVAVQ